MRRWYLSITQGFKSIKPCFFTHTKFNTALDFEKHEYRDIQKDKKKLKKNQRNSVFKGKYSGVNLFHKFLIYECVRIYDQKEAIYSVESAQDSRFHFHQNGCLISVNIQGI